MFANCPRQVQIEKNSFHHLCAPYLTVRLSATEKKNLPLDCSICLFLHCEHDYTCMKK